MAFNVDAFREAHRPWAFAAGARTYEARHVSAPAVVDFHARFHAATTERERVRAIQQLLRLAFPRRLSYRWRGDPVRMILALEPAAQREALTDFFACLEGRSPSSPLPTTPGKPSSTPSPTA